MRRVFTECDVATMEGGYDLIPDAAIAVEGGVIEWVGARAELPPRFAEWERAALGGLVTPAPIDCHTHLVFGGDRAGEFEMRLQGASYEQIARAGGGIVSTVRATREADEEALLEAALPRLDALIAEGVATVEIKSGYGLTVEDELKMLRVARALAEMRPVRVIATYLGAHAVPPEYAGRADAYIDEVAIPGLVEAKEAGLVDAVDGFCEGIAFTPDQIARVFEVARHFGLPIRLHADQLSNLHGAALAARYGALSADHLEHVDRDGVEAMAASGMVAVMLPGAFYTLRETQAPPIELFREKGAPMAVATDLNPGSSPLHSLLLAMNMACTLFRMTPEEALLGVTAHAAAALGLHDCGVIAHGRRADLAVWSVSRPAELAYRIGFNPLKRRVFGGEIV